jgi:hypothetical protein
VKQQIDGLILITYFNLNTIVVIPKLAHRDSADVEDYRVVFDGLGITTSKARQ